MTKTLGDAESHVRELLAESDRQTEIHNIKPVISETDTTVTKEEDKPFRAEASSDEPHQESPDAPEEDEEASSEEVSAEENSDIPAEPDESEDKQAVKDKVLSMFHQGYSELEIAKETGKGMGEIQMILDLFDEKEDE